MRKIICDICGTTYPETSECCPICGCVNDSAVEMPAEDLLQEESALYSNVHVKKKEIFDFDEVNAEPEEEEEYEEDEYEEEEEYDEEEEEEEAPRHNTFVVILLTVLIASLLAAAGFIFVRYFLPNKGAAEETLPVQSAAVAEMTEVATEPTVPCETLIIGSGSVAELNAQGQHFLLHIKAMPENTTDRILYVSADEAVATVTEDGRITAMAEGETIIYISCGKVTLECPVIVRYVEETVPATTEAIVEETEAAAQIEAPAETAAASESAASAVDSSIVLKLKKTDIRLGVYYQFTLELDCDLEQTQVQWSSEHPHIATVDEKGVVTAVKSGTTAIIARYGDQEVQCMVRCG